MELNDTKKYGNRFWVVKTSLSKSGEIRLLADQVIIGEDGSLCFIKKNEKEENLNLALAAGQWTACYAASMLDGHPVAVDHWDGELA